jgi:hypothetical protein
MANGYMSPRATVETPWHALHPQRVAELLSVDPALGLSDEEATRAERSRARRCA